jgi:hypothetical protein
MINIPKIGAEAERFGLHRGPGGAHGNRTIMMSELERLFAASGSCDEKDTLRALIIDDNVLLKQTESNRREVFVRLRVMYGLDPSIPLYRALRRLWEFAQDRPLLALLVALGRDCLLRSTAPTVLAAPMDQTVRSHDLEQDVEDAFPGRYTVIVKASVSRHAASSWTQSGHLVGRYNKTRAAANPGPAAIAMALLLADACGDRGLPMYESFWLRSLDITPARADSLAVIAHRRGWIDYRRQADVLEIGFKPLLADCGEIT